MDSEFMKEFKARLKDYTDAQTHQIEGVEKRLAKKIEAQDQWISRVEAARNTTRSIEGASDEARTLAESIPQEYRHLLDRADAIGMKDPATKVFFALSTHFEYKRLMSMRRQNERTTGDWEAVQAKMFKDAGWDYQHAITKAALGEGAAGGGNVIPLPVERILQRLIADNGVVRPLVTKIPMSGPTVRIPSEANSVSVSIVAENGTIPDAVATTAFAQPQLVAKKIAGLATISNEILETNIIGLVDYLFTAMGERIGRTEDAEALDGQGTNYTGLAITSGVVSITVTGTAASGGVAPTYADLVALVYAAQERSTRDGGAFVMHPIAMKNIVALVDSQGMPIFQFSNVPGAVPNRLLGYPVFLSTAVSKTNSLYTSSTNIYFGPFTKMIFGDLRGMDLAIDPYGLFASDQTRLRVTERLGIVTPVGAYFSFLKGVRNS